MSHRDDDLRMLDELLGVPGKGHTDMMTEVEVEAFADMRWGLRAYQGLSTPHRAFEFLTEKQRAWLTAVHERVTGGSYENLASRGLVARGKEVASMVGALPKKPPPLPRPAAPQRASQEHRPFKATGLDEKDDEEES